MDRKLQKEMDLAAEKLDRKGYKDLADKVDRYNVRLVKASDVEKKVIARALRRIDDEATRRGGGKEKRESGRSDRTSTVRRRMAIRKRMRERAGRDDRGSLSRARRSIERDPRRARQERLSRGERGGDRSDLAKRLAKRRALRRLRERR